MEKILYILGGIALGLLVIVGAALLVYRALRPKVEEKSKEKAQNSEEKTVLYWAKHPIALIGYGLIIFNLISWQMIPWWWNIITYSVLGFLIFNLGFWSVLYLRTIKVKDALGKDTKEDHPTASKIASILATMLILGLVTTAWQSHQKSTTTTTSLGKSSDTASYSNIPVDVAKRVVCECESGCQQFETDGKTPYKNRGIPKEKVPPSTAFGKYQFLEVHREPAKKLGYDLNTEEGQEKYFEYLYGKEGFGPWDHDQKYGGGSACWGPKLLTLGYGDRGKKTNVLLGAVDAPVGGWSTEVKTPQPDVVWGRIDTKKGGKCEVMRNRDQQKVTLITEETKDPGLKVLQFKCSEEGARIEVFAKNSK
ncbi:MAG: hypothetical protein AAB350_00900 [Patescibacteria group bacterium]|mgnify:CR=1 FL=1